MTPAERFALYTRARLVRDFEKKAAAEGETFHPTRTRVPLENGGAAHVCFVHEKLALCLYDVPDPDAVAAMFYDQAFGLINAGPGVHAYLGPDLKPLR